MSIIFLLTYVVYLILQLLLQSDNFKQGEKILSNTFHFICVHTCMYEQYD